MENANATIPRVKRAFGLLLAVSVFGCGRAADRSASSSPAPKPSASATAPAPTPQPIDTTTPLPSPLPMIAARVNGRAITTAQVVVLAEPLLAKRVFKEKIAAYRGTLNQLVVRELLLEEALARSLVADEKSVQQGFDEARVAFKDDAGWAEFLKTQALTPESYRAELRAKQTIAVLLSQEAERVPLVSEAEAKLFYDQNPNLVQIGEKLKAAHILIPAPPGATAQAQAEARVRAVELRGRILAGQDFAKLAAQYSSDKATASKGGALEPFGRGQMPQAFAAAAFAMIPGELSEVVETPLGYHLIRLYERIPGSVPSFDQIKEPLRQQLSMAPRQEYLQTFINKLKAKAKIETFL